MGSEPSKFKINVVTLYRSMQRRRSCCSVTMKAANNTLSSLLLLCVCRFGAHAKEIIATNEWQKVGPTDTVPAGLEIRMDLSGGGKWARLPPPEEEEDISQPPHAKHCGPSCKERQKQRAEKRRAAGFKLREASHTTRRRQHEEEELQGSARALPSFT